MTNPELTKELKDKLKEGVKPSDLKKLKRSKSADDINPNPPFQLLQDQLQQKQKEIELLREKLETKNSELAQTQTELDNSLLARQKSNKQFTLVYDKLQELKLQLTQTEDEATDDIISQDEEITKLRNQKSQMKGKITELEGDLNLAQRLAELRKNPLPNSETNENPLNGIIIGLFLVAWLISLLNVGWKQSFGVAKQHRFKDN